MTNADLPPTTSSAVPKPSWGFLGFVTVFIIYGSLFPFDFLEAPKPLALLFSEFTFPGSIPDATDNFLLFVPLGIALALSFRGMGQLSIASGLALLTLGLGLQLLQLYLPSRSASVTDVIWNSLGMLSGLAAVWPLREWLSRKAGAGKTDIDPFAALLVFIWLTYESFPFVPTLDIGLLREHVKSAINAPPFEAMRLVQHLLAATLGGFALQRSGLFGRSVRSVLTLGTLVVILEIFVAYGSLRRETLLGMFTGLGLGYLLGKKANHGATLAITTTALGALLLTVLTPYRRQASDGGFTLTPFSSIFWQGVSVDLPPLAFETLAIAMLIWFGQLTTNWPRRHPHLWLGLILLLLMALEVIRVAGMGFHGDTSTLLLAIVLGPFASAHRNIRISPRPPIPSTSKLHATSTQSPRRRVVPVSWIHAFTVCGISLLIYAMSRLPGIPYNVRELIPSGIDGVLAAISLAMAIYLGANSPFLIFHPRYGRQMLISFPLLLVAQGLAVWFLLRISIPVESLHDILGSPIWGWPWDWELLVRFVALHQVIATQIVGAVLLGALIISPSILPNVLYWVILSLTCAWPLQHIVIGLAATDNLTELIKDSGAFYHCTLLIVGLLLLLTSACASMAALLFSRRKYWLWLVPLVGIPLGAFAIHAGLEPVIVKYGKVFSALQFLLSPDRQHYLHPETVLAKFAIVCFGISALAALLQWTSWRQLCTSTPTRI